MALGYASAYGAAGANEGLQQLLARRMLERKQAEEEFQNRESNSIKRWETGGQLKEQAAGHAEQLRAHQAAEADRDLQRQQQITLRQMMSQDALDRQREQRAGSLERLGQQQTFQGQQNQNMAELRRDLASQSLAGQTANQSAGREQALAIAKMMEVGRQEQRTLAAQNATPEHAAAVAGAVATAKEGAKPPSFLSGVKDYLFPGHKTQPTAPALTGPRPGTTRSVNGKTYTWDGKGWK